MRGDYKILIAPTALPVSLSYLKEHAKIDYTVEDTVLNGYLLAAINEVEQYTNRALMEQTIFQTLDGFPVVCSGNIFAEIRLFRSPVKELVKLEYYDVTGTKTTLYNSTGSATEQAAVLLHNVKEPATISVKVGEDWPSTATRPAAVEVTYKAGYNSADEVPNVLKQAVCLLASAHYEKREDYVKKLKTAAEKLMDLEAVQGW